MALIYPPYIEGKIKAQVENYLEVPFELNRAIGYGDIRGLPIYARIKNPSTNTPIGGLLVGAVKSTKQADIYIAQFYYETDDNNLIFPAMQIGQYYKLQLSFDQENYSTVAIFKYTAAPTVSIEELDVNLTNKNLYTYIGKYQSEKDSSEKVYHYWFELYQNGVLIETSGELLHNSTQDTDTKSSQNSYSLQTGLNPYEYYQIRYVVRTNNDMVIASPMYFIQEGAELEDNNKIIFNTQTNIESGGIDLYIEASEQGLVAGEYAFYRSESTGSWTKIGTVTFDIFLKQNEKIQFYSDYTIQQGVSYRYALQRFHNALLCKKIESDEVCCDFEDIFLSDTERQVKIRFNPKIANFKDTILESKMDTIGGKFPFVFRNGRTKYKEFSISGLISMLMNDNDTFIEIRSKTPQKDQNKTTYTTNLTSENFTNERDFKLELLAWLNNGKLKLFRSAAEGNYIVRLLNVSLTPNDTLSRMLHTFQATAYEMAEFSIGSLLKLGFLGAPINYKQELHFSTIDISQYLQKTTIPVASAVKLTIENAYSNQPAIKIVFKDGTDFSPIISHTGIYELTISPSNPVVEIETIPGSIGNVTLATQGLDSYPILDSMGQEIIDYTLEEVATQWHFDENSKEPTINIKNYKRITYLTIEIPETKNAESGVLQIKWSDTDESSTTINVYKNKDTNDKVFNGSFIDLQPYLWDKLPVSLACTGHVLVNMYGQRLTLITTTSNGGET